MDTKPSYPKKYLSYRKANGATDTGGDGTIVDLNAVVSLYDHRGRTYSGIKETALVRMSRAAFVVHCADCRMPRVRHVEEAQRVTEAM